MKMFKKMLLLSLIVLISDPLIVPKYSFGDISEQRKLPPPSHRRHNVMASVITAKLPVSFEVIFESQSGEFEGKNTLSQSTFDSELERHVRNFEKDFSKNFKFGSKWSNDHKKFGMAALSNMLGGMAYFYGHSLVQNGEEPVKANWDGPLFTAVPSRSFFPRGFLWDEESF